MSTTEDEFYYFTAIQFSGDARLGKKTAPIRFRLLKLIHSLRRWVDPSGLDMVPISLQLHQQTVTFPGGQFTGGPSEISYGESNWVNERRFQVPVSNFRAIALRPAYINIITAYLKSLRVPEDKHAAIIEKLSRVILRAAPGLPISVRIVRVTRQVAPKAITLYMERLEKVRIDAAGTTNTPCAICTEDFTDSDDEKIIIRLPCLHLYHRDCIAPWLERRQVCPLCRCSMPLLKAASRSSSIWPSRSSSAWPRWPMLLLMSSGGIITATLLCRLLKRAA